MTSTNLPVLVLNDLILLPNVEIRLETKNKNIIKVIEMAHSFSDDHLLVVPNLNPLEENINISELPRIGIIAKVIKRMSLHENNVRIILKGINRVVVHNYNPLNEKREIIEADIGHLYKFDINKDEEEGLVAKTKQDYINLIENNHNLSNSLLSVIEKIKSASELSDVLALNLTASNDRLIKYMITPNPMSRIKMVLEDIKRENEVLKIEREIDFKLKENLDKNQKEFILKEKIKLIKTELGETNSKDDDIEDIKEKMKKIKLPNKIRLRLEKEISRYEMIPSMSPEISIVRNYIDWLLSLPWNHKSKDDYNLKRVLESLDDTHFGLEEPKNRIIEYLAVKQMSKNLKSPIICFVGPPGTGKTSLAKSIAKSLGRSFVNISVGGIRDEAEITGHRRTYIGASPGRIIQAIKKSKFSNPVFLIDEIDKMGSDIKGDPTNALLDILDPEQNKYFSDNYIEEPYDLSNVMFITTANYLYQIPAPLRDRLEIIELQGYTDYEKLDIAQNHLLPRIYKEHGISEKQIIFREEAILTIIKEYTKEAGARNLERELSKVIRKIITEMVYKNEKNRKTIINSSDLKKYLGKKKFSYNKRNNDNKIGVANGLAYTTFGGDILKIEVNLYPGKGDLQLTGSLGDVMKESAQIALSYIKSHHKKLNIKYDKIKNNDIHIHVPEGAVPKDGPSAGITLTTALISAFSENPVISTVGMTGEMTLRGEVLPIGGLKHKAMGAYQGGLKTVLIPYENEHDLDEISLEIKNKIDFILVKNYQDVIENVFEAKL